MMIIKLLTNVSTLKDSLRIIEIAGRTCYGSNPGENPDGFIRRLIRSGHESVIEHGTATFRISGVSRALTHQLVRHRLASYSQRSQRYVTEDGFPHIIPQAITNAKFNGDDRAYKAYWRAISEAWAQYNLLLDLGIPREDARFVLPNACCTEIVMTMNFRELRHFLKLRLAKNAQWEISSLSYKILKILHEYVPIIVEDIWRDYHGKK